MHYIEMKKLLIERLINKNQMRYHQILKKIIKAIEKKVEKVEKKWKMKFIKIWEFNEKM